jgi:polar amino acid transport system substrate-binding protein
MCSGLLAMCLTAVVAASDLRLVTGDDHAPYTGRQLPEGGMLTMIVQAALQQRHIASSLDWRPWNRGYQMTLKSQYDATFPYVRSPEREADFLYSDPILVVRNYAFSLSSAPLEIDNLEEVQGKRLCLPLGWQAPDALQKLLDQGLLKLHTPPSLIACAELLLLGRNDFFVATESLGDAALQSTAEPLSRVHRSRQSFGDNTLHVIVSRRHAGAEELVQTINQGLAQLHESGAYTRLIERYLQMRYEQASR